MAKNVLKYQRKKRCGEKEDCGGAKEDNKKNRANM